MAVEGFPVYLSTQPSPAVFLGKQDHGAPIRQTLGLPPDAVGLAMGLAFAFPSTQWVHWDN